MSCDSTSVVDRASSIERLGEPSTMRPSSIVVVSREFGSSHTSGVSGAAVFIYSAIRRNFERDEAGVA
ncbi:MAG: hypothetical protein M3R53_10235 [Candidatus Eremiobacteraeota bacterium]|nr:hypothetical protein [Candidatus Eremiobacteraeota bacterium]